MRRPRELLLLIALLVLVHAALFAAAWWLKGRYELAAPHWLWALASVPLLATWYIIRRNQRRPHALLSTVGALRNGPVDVLARLRHLPFALALLGLGLMLLAMARPQGKDSWRDVTHEGIDIVIAMDYSASMLAKDFRPDRLEAARDVGIQFINGRPNDRIGLVVYEGEAYTQCPLTTDHAVLQDLFLHARTGLITGGTAIGMGLATAVNRLRESTNKSKVVILLTDGMNNAGTIQPLDAAQIAQELGIRVYTIGVGSRGMALSPVAIYPNGQYKYDYVQVDIDDAMLQKIADMTGARYFRATDEKKLRTIYQEIDRLEKTRMKVTEHDRRTDEYARPLLAGCSLLLLSLLLGHTLLRTTP
ncbi:MAG: VWA domain-containing protein [Flavobacteriales bacterium]|nr:VWA domain-containing protein [Flavobacteriales bacterium]MBP9080383.1 VWA domain-containing protein [Flavobacteriales bacterium]